MPLGHISAQCSQLSLVTPADLVNVKLDQQYWRMSKTQSIAI